MAEKITQTAGRNALGTFAPEFAHFNGVVLFGKQEFYRNIFLINQFAIFDYETSNIMVILGNMAMFVMWCYVGYYVLKGMSLLSNKTLAKKKGHVFQRVPYQYSAAWDSKHKFTLEDGKSARVIFELQEMQ